MAGGKGGSTTTSVEVPEYIEEAAKRNLTRADTISRIGYVPYYGADVAAFTPLQEAAFQNVAGQAGAFGLTTPAGGATAGMPAPQEFAGGIRGYSSAPMYEEALGTLRERRPAQVALMESLFIDPVTGQVGANVAAPIDYTTAFPQTPVAPVDTGDSGGGGGGGGGGTTDAVGVSAPYLGVDPYDPEGDDNFLTQDEYNANVDIIQEAIGDPSYDPQTETLSAAEIAAIENADNRAEIIQAQDAIYMNQQQIYGSDTGNNVTSLVTGGYTGGGSGGVDSGSGMSMAEQIANEAENYANTGKTFDMNDPSTWSSPANTPTGFVGNNDTGSNTFAQTMANVFTPFDDKEYVDGVLVADDDGSPSGSSTDDDCVIATHAVAAGGFTPSMKREAVVWCMNVLHDKWWGEAIRRGYRHLGRKKIEQGKAHEHYAEFRDYIAFANGKKRTLKGAINFTFRTGKQEPHISLQQWHRRQALT
jgi:hypothetical protein